MYESNFVFHFARLWGYEEGRAGRGFEARLIGNSQNRFDELIGDVAGQSGKRFFLIEFKRTRDGFLKEVEGSHLKPHRRALYEHLKVDATCRKFARFGHWGGYADSDGNLFFEPYAHAMVPIDGRALEAHRKRLRAEWEAGVRHVPHELDTRSSVICFNDFFGAATDRDIALWDQDKRLFGEGLGIPKETLQWYVECMYQHLGGVELSSGDAVLVAINSETKAMTYVMDSIESLVRDVHSAFERSARIQPSNSLSVPTGKKRPRP